MAHARLRLVTAEERVAAPPPSAASALGLGAATTAGVAASLAALGQLLAHAGRLEGAWGELAASAPSLALAPAFLLACVALHARTGPARNAWTLGAVALAGLYAALSSGVDVAQLAVVIPAELGGDPARPTLSSLHPIGLLEALRTFATTMMGLSFALLSVGLPPQQRWLRRALAVSALAAPILPGLGTSHPLALLAIVRLVVEPAALFGLARLFAREG